MEFDRGCRTKITVKVDGDVETLWKNWSNGLHRQTVYGNLAKDLGRFCRYTRIKMVDEAAKGDRRESDDIGWHSEPKTKDGPAAEDSACGCHPYASAA